MGKIIQLDEHIANMIAAGEVVERPMGIVKELVENAIDAHSTRIEVSVLEGGMEKIEVSDNGDGMDRLDARNAFLRHATSKIKIEADLFDIHSLGFRGEALPSIASVSKLEMITSDGNESTKLTMHYGEEVEVLDYPCNKGTSITVTSLFYKTPARLKHLRSAAYENSLIQDVIVRFAFSHPEIAFTLVSNGKVAFRSSGQGNLLEVIYQAWGSEVAKLAIPVRFEDYDYQVSGYLIKPSITRSSRYFMHCFMNGRMIKTYRLMKAIEDGYEDFIVKGRYPLVVLNIEVDPKLLDVNVHPSKWEIRISKQNQLEYLIKDEVRKALKNDVLAPFSKVEEARVVTPASSKPIMQPQKELIEEAPAQIKQEEKPTYYKQQQLDTDVVLAPSKDPYFQRVAQTNVIQTNENQDEKPSLEIEKPVVVKQDEVELEMQEVPVSHRNPSFPEMQVIGQLHEKFILCALPEGLAIIDQHAAQERVHYEEFQKILNTSPAMSPLLVPLVFTVGHDLVKRVDEINALIQDEIHVQFEVFGDDTLRVREVPVWMKDLDANQFLSDVLENFQNDVSSKFTRMEKKRIATMACHSSIRFNRPLTKMEMEEVVNQLAMCENPYHCPHGRPTFIIMDEKELTKEFLR